MPEPDDIDLRRMIERELARDPGFPRRVTRAQRDWEIADFHYRIACLQTTPGQDGPELDLLRWQRSLAEEQVVCESERFARRVVERVGGVLPAAVRGRYVEEWRGELAGIDGRWARLGYLVRLTCRAPAMRWAVRGARAERVRS